MLSSNNNEGFKRFFGEEVETGIREEFFAELREEKALLMGLPRDFNQSLYFREIDPTEEQILNQYLQKIFRTIII